MLVKLHKNSHMDLYIKQLRTSFVPDGANANLWFVHVFFRHARRVEHGLGSPTDLGLG